MVQELASGLPSNYHRDLQLLKKPLFGAVASMRSWLDVLIALVPALQVDAVKAAAACSDDIYAAHQARVRRLLAVERLRRRIAADLHDDIGASLSRVAILSEVVKQQVGPDQPEPNRRLSEIAQTARGLVETMSDIVWSVDPRRDDLNSVIVRAREFASDVLMGKSLAWEVQGDEVIERVKLDPAQRRHLYLVFKEVLTNIARHSESRSVSIALRVEHGRFWAVIRDDGRGFDPEQANGRGLENMRSRIAQLDGQLLVDSARGEGACVTLDVPLPARHRGNFRGA